MAGAVIEFTDATFDTEVIKSDVVVLVDFWAEWCGPCKMLAPIVEKIAEDETYQGKVKIGKVNVDDNPNTASHFGIQAIPTLLLFKDGAIVDRVVGVTSEKEIRKKIDANI
jgi:thioredoxin 1